jgi:hypothetical protein
VSGQRGGGRLTPLGGLVDSHEKEPEEETEEEPGPDDIDVSGVF